MSDEGENKEGERERKGEDPIQKRVEEMKSQQDMEEPDHERPMTADDVDVQDPDEWRQLERAWTPIPRQFRANRHINVPKEVHEEIGYKGGENRYFLRWGIDTENGFIVLTTKELETYAEEYDEDSEDDPPFVTDKQKRYKEKASEDWSTTIPTDVLKHDAAPDIEEGDYVVFVSYTEWLEDDPKLVYLLSNDQWASYIDQGIKTSSAISLSSDEFHNLTERFADDLELVDIFRYAAAAELGELSELIEDGKIRNQVEDSLKGYFSRCSPVLEYEPLPEADAEDII